MAGHLNPQPQTLFRASFWEKNITVSQSCTFYINQCFKLTLFQEFILQLSCTKKIYRENLFSLLRCALFHTPITICWLATAFPNCTASLDRNFLRMLKQSSSSSLRSGTGAWREHQDVSFALKRSGLYRG